MQSAGDIQEALIPILGQAVCRQRIGRGKSLSIGIGEKVPHGKAGRLDAFYGKWEIGTYSAAWRVISNGLIILGSNDEFITIEEMDEAFQEVKLGRVIGIAACKEFDLTVQFSEEMKIEFIAASASGDELFHIFAPLSAYLEYSSGRGWQIGRADTPWV